MIEGLVATHDKKNCTDQLVLFLVFAGTTPSVAFLKQSVLVGKPKHQVELQSFNSFLSAKLLLAAGGLCTSSVGTSFSIASVRDVQKTTLLFTGSR